MMQEDVKKDHIDILGDELKYDLPYWLAPPALDWDAMRVNQIKHRDKWLAEQRAKKSKSEKSS
jgi:hypothetical protein